MRINPKNFFQRELDFLPPHFVNTVVKTHERGIQDIKTWIYENCHGRYSITKDVIFDNGTSKAVYVLGFENPGDLTLLALSGITQKHQN
jgi:hypothetical protein